MIKRKLRSHTRQQHSDLSFAKSPSSSPTTVLQDNQINDNHVSDQNCFRPMHNNIVDINSITELSNDGYAQELEIENSVSPTNLDTKVNARRRRCQSQIQPLTMADFLITENYDNNNVLSNNIINDLNNELEYKSHKEELDSIQINLVKVSNQQDSLKNMNQINSDNNETVISKNVENYDLNSTRNCLPINGIKQYIEIKNQISKRREFLMQLKEDLRFPKIFQDFAVNKKNYLIKKNKEIRQLVPFVIIIFLILVFFRIKA